MSSLNASLNTAVQALFASTGAIQTTNNNIANVNTPGYNRETVVLQTATPNLDGSGNGVDLQGYQSVRNEVLQTQIQQQTQANSSADAQSTQLQQIQTMFSTSSTDIGTEMSNLFKSITALQTNPSDLSSRQAVLSAGQDLASSFNTTANQLTSQQTSLNTQVTQDVNQINQLSKQIASLTPQINAMKAAGQDGGSVQSQQDQLITQLSQLTNLQVTQNEQGITLSTGNGTPLVVGGQSYSLQTSIDSNGMASVYDGTGNNITSSISAGDLGGTLQIRDTTIPKFLSQLDTLASQVGTAFNNAQAQGKDLSGATGGTFFNLPSTTAGTAASISLALTGASQLAASSDGTSGSNGNLANFIAIQNTKLPSGDTPTNTYANLVFQVGTVAASANAESSGTAASLLQLNDQRNSISGVSIDEETTNLIRFQQSYQAAAKVINTINQLFSVTINMISN